MKKVLLSMMTGSVMMVVPFANADSNFTYVSTGLQFGKADNALFRDNQTESALGAFFDASWNFYDNVFASYSISYSSFDGKEWSHSWYNGGNYGSESGQDYFSTTRQYYSLSYFIPMNKFTPYISLGYVDYKLSGSTYESSGQASPGTIDDYSDTVGGAAGEIGTYFQVTAHYKMKFSYNYAALEDDGAKVNINEFYFGNDYAFSDNWSAVANISYRDIATINTNEISTQFGVKYNF
ncbi:outer membrane beta-barrel protein [Moritella sp. 24]|uniref:outer membrane beta-barrel protein n=1 Tax=Moritella sp. 24 TaxID=2746230 RepID=UPI001BAA1F6A|nr:outer membrane beta-barrel protein [Moritella sp. 24]QUM74999.1 outer membrane beta-barrel protein [Moritella sp. 24]